VYYGVVADLGIVQDTLGAGSDAAQAAGEREATLEFSASGHIYEARSGRYMGEGNRIDDSLDPLEPLLYCVLPYRVQGIELTWEDGKAKARLQAGAACGEHVFRFEILDGQGKPVPDAGANVVAASGAAEWTPAEAVEAGARVTCRDVATGVVADVEA
jgi:hypothetical protein